MSEFGWNTTAEEVGRCADLRGQQVVLTGASSGIGVDTARALVKAGADLVLGVRDPGRARIVLGGIFAKSEDSITLLPLDLSDLDSVLRFAAHITGPVDSLIANAGVSLSPESHLPNGLDVRFATNHLGHFLLALKLHAQMAERGARIVVLSSAGHKGMPVRLDDLQWHDRRYHAGAAYAESKSANILFAQEATKRWGGDGIFANAVLPGSALTGLQRFHSEELKRLIGFMDEDGNVDPMVKTSAQAAATTLWAVTAPELAGRGGLVLEDCAEALPVGPDTHAWAGFDASVADPETARLLWEQSLALINSLLPGWT